MIKDLIKDDLVRGGIVCKNIDNILNEAIKIAEETFGKDIKQIPPHPQSEEKEFLYNLIENLIKEDNQKGNISDMVKQFCMSDKSFKDFLKETTSVGGMVGSMGRGGLYDTTRVIFNGGNPNQKIPNTDQDDRDEDITWNTDIGDKIPDPVDVYKSIGDNGISKDDYFGKKDADVIQDEPKEFGYDVTQHVKFHQQGDDEVQEGEVIGFSDSDDPEIKKLVKIKVTKGSKAGKILDIRLKNVKDRIKKDIKNITSDEQEE